MLVVDCFTLETTEVHSRVILYVFVFAVSHSHKVPGFRKFKRPTTFAGMNPRKFLKLLENCGQLLSRRPCAGFHGKCLSL